MALAPGTWLGSYEVVSAIGAGGMGEVYSARDSKLNRVVALKILSAAFAADPERLARFRREAQVLASLNHPNIAAIHGFEDSGATHALVMELVPGRTLAEVITAPLPVSEALPIARQIAAALEAAHEQGIVHRDLKPANIKLTDAGTVKVLDFGLAKAMEDSSSFTSLTPSQVDPATMTSPAVTVTGVILGTAGYMAPEQAKGKTVDRRADIWALGVVLFEMLAGRRLYRGETVTETIAHVITQPPDWSALPASTPAPVVRLLRRCLEKDPRNRLQSAGDARIEIDEYLAGANDGTGRAVAAIVPSTPRWRRLLPWTIAGALVVAQAFALWPREAVPARPLRLDVRIGSGEQLVVDENVDGPVAVLSPDGMTLAYLGLVGTSRRLFLRPLDRLESTALAGTEGAIQHFFSPDGRSIAFFSDGMLRRINVTGGPPVPIAPAADARGGTWGADDTLVYTPALVTGLMRVPAAGGTPVEVTPLGANERTHRWPFFLPDGRTVLFTCQLNTGSYDDGTIEAVRLDTRERKVLIRGGTAPRYVTTGHLVYTRQNTVFAVPFDPGRLEVRGEPQPVASGVMSAGAAVGAGSGNGASQIDIASNGAAVYIQTGERNETNSRLAVVDRTGKAIYTFPEKRPFRDPRFSPDGTRIAIRVGDGKGEQVHVLDPRRETLTKMTFDGSLSGLPIWSNDGQFLAYFSDRAGKGLDIYMIRSDGGGEVKAVTSGGGSRIPGSFSPDGRLLAAFDLNPRTNMDVVMVSLADGAITPFVNSPAVEVLPSFSPDGKWIVYQSGAASNENIEIFVRAYPDGSGRRQVSNGGGVMPYWTKDGRELIFGTQTSSGLSIMAVDVTGAGATLTLGKPRKLFELPLATPTDSTWFAAAPDGSRFAVLLREGAAAVSGLTHVTLILNFFDEIRRVTSGAAR